MSDRDTADYLEERKRIAGLFTTEVAVQNLPNLLDIEFDSEVWQTWGAKCLGCGSCAMVENCVSESIRMSSESAVSQIPAIRPADPQRSFAQESAGNTPR